MTSPSQPHRPLIVDDLDLGVSGAMAIGTGGKRKTANQKQREKAAAEAEYERWRQAMGQELWPNWGRR